MSATSGDLDQWISAVSGFTATYNRQMMAQNMFATSGDLDKLILAFSGFTVTYNVSALTRRSYYGVELTITIAS